MLRTEYFNNRHFPRELSSTCAMCSDAQENFRRRIRQTITETTKRGPNPRRCRQYILQLAVETVKQAIGPDLTFVNPFEVFI